MKIMKLLASCAMVGALTAVCASGAFADAAVTATYTAADAEAETGAKVTVAVTDYAVTGDYTVLVLNEDVDAESRGENAGKVTNADITQIDQWNGTTTIELALPDDIADGTYYVRVGGAAPTEDNANGYIATTFTVGGDVEPILVGDANGDTAITALDCSEIFKYIGKMDTSISTTDANWYAAAYCTGDTAITALDCSEIFKYIGKMSVTNVGTEIEPGSLGEKPVE